MFFSATNNRYQMQAATLLVIALITFTFPTPTSAQGSKHRAVRQEVELLVHTVALGLGGILTRTASPERQQELIRNFVAPVSVFPDKSGYLFVLRLDGYCVAHGDDKSMQGRNLKNFKTEDGLPLFRQMKKLVEEQGSGFLEYKWPKPGTIGLYHKLGYAERIPGTSYIVGSGIYYPTPSSNLTAHLR